MNVREHVVLLVGGVGGAKLALGLSHVLRPDALTIIANTADDFEHLGLLVSPDLDTVMYTLAGLASPQTGWGIAGDTLEAMTMVERLGGPTWFCLGDRDLGTNLMRTALLRQGHTLTEATERLCRALGVVHPLLPMCDDPVRTMLETDRGILAFQEYFVRERWQPVVSGMWYEGTAAARPTPAVRAALDAATLIVFGPSNPYLSIDPILAVSGIRERIAASNAPCVAVSPIVGGQALKGPAAKLMAELGADVSSRGIAQHYEDLLDGIILDNADSALCTDGRLLGIPCAARQTIMQTLDDKIELADALLHWVEENLL